jgi:hypothetical protein
MKAISANALRELATDIAIELEQLTHLEQGISQAYAASQTESDRAALFYESLALKFHNFYTGCERIFHLIASELNGALPSGYDWHKRLLHRMSVAHEGYPPLLTPETTRLLEEYLAFRHVVRHVYGFELDPQRLQILVAHYPPVWQQVESQIRDFVNWLRTLADQMSTRVTEPTDA